MQAQQFKASKKKVYSSNILNQKKSILRVGSAGGELTSALPLSNSEVYIHKLSLYFSGFKTSKEEELAYREADLFLETNEGKEMLKNSKKIVRGVTLESMLAGIKQKYKVL